jgi:hypothetical protein
MAQMCQTGAENSLGGEATGFPLSGAQMASCSGKRQLRPLPRRVCPLAFPNCRPLSWWHLQGKCHRVHTHIDSQRPAPRARAFPPHSLPSNQAVAAEQCKTRIRWLAVEKEIRRPESVDLVVLSKMRSATAQVVPPHWPAPRHFCGREDCRPAPWEPCKPRRACWPPWRPAHGRASPHAHPPRDRASPVRTQAQAQAQQKGPQLLLTVPRCGEARDWRALAKVVGRSFWPPRQLRWPTLVASLQRRRRSATTQPPRRFGLMHVTLSGLRFPLILFHLEASPHQR